jgi:hypothetical protein
MPSIKSTTSIKSTNTSKSASTISTKVSSNSNRQHRTLEHDPLIGMTIEFDTNNTDLKSVFFSDDHNTTKTYSLSDDEIKYKKINHKTINKLSSKLKEAKILMEKFQNEINYGKGNKKDKKNLEIASKNINRYINEIHELSKTELKPVTKKIIPILELELKSDDSFDTNTDNKSLASSDSSTISTASGGSISLNSNARIPVRRQDSDLNTAPRIPVRRQDSDTDSDTDLQQALLGDAKHQDGEKKPRAK